MQTIIKELKTRRSELDRELSRINAALQALDGAVKRKVMPESAKQRISEFQKARWARYHAQQKREAK